MSKGLDDDQTFRPGSFECARAASHRTSHSMPCLYSFAPEYA